MNIFDYLTWRGDVPFSIDPFNEVDNLVLCQLAYTDFGDVLEAGESCPLCEVARRFFAKHTREEIINTPSFYARAPLLMEGMVAGARFQDLYIKNYINIVDHQQTAQISATTFLPGDGHAFVAFRGTDNTLVGWKEDLALGYQVETYGQKRAVAYLEEAASQTDLPLYVGGHSKGGNFAIYAASFCDPEIQKRILRVFSNDGPGFREEITAREDYHRILPRVTQIVPEESVFGMLLTHLTEPKVIRSDASGIMQHDCLSWQVEKNVFVPGTLSEKSLIIKRAMSEWIREMDDDSRKFLSNTLFSVLEATGESTIYGVVNSKLKVTEALMNSLSELPREERNALLSWIGVLFKSGSRSAVTVYKEKRAEEKEKAKE